MKSRWPCSRRGSTVLGTTGSSVPHSAASEADNRTIWAGSDIMTSLEASMASDTPHSCISSINSWTGRLGCPRCNSVIPPSKSSSIASSPGSVVSATIRWSRSLRLRARSGVCSLGQDPLLVVQEDDLQESIKADSSQARGMQKYWRRQSHR